MLILLAVFALLLLAGSLFPWNFQSGPPLTEAVWHVLTSWNASLLESPLHDRLVNLVIYVPIGFTFYLWDGWHSRLARWLWPLLAGFALSFSIETLQHYTPPRVPALVDVVCNTISTLLGIILAAVLHSALESRQIEWRRRYSIHLSSALLLLAIWISASGWPVHAFPLGLGTRVRALLHSPLWLPLDALEGALYWLVAGCLLAAVTGPRAARWWLPLLLPGVFLLRLISPGHDFTWSHLAGALAGVIFFWLLPERHRHASAWLAGFWLAWIVLDGLRPFTWQTSPNSFHPIPFSDLVNSSWMPGIGVLLEKTTIYGVAYWLFAHTTLSRWASLILITFTLFAIEAAQCWLPGRVASMTDPAIGLIAAALLWLVDRRFTHPGSPVTAPQPQLR